MSSKTYNFLIVDWKDQQICVKLWFTLRNIVLETHEIIKDAFGENAVGKKRRLNGSLDSNERKILLDNVRVQVVSPQAALQKMWKNFTKLKKDQKGTILEVTSIVRPLV